MRFDELALRIPGDELRMRFHERLTVLSGIGALERQGVVEGLLGTLTGAQRHDTVLTYVDSAGRRASVTRGSRGEVVHTYEDGTGAPDFVAEAGLRDGGLLELCCLGAGDLGLLAPMIGAPAPPELVEARHVLTELTQQLDAALAAQQAAEAMRGELGDIDELLRTAEEDAAKRRYARLLAQLERVRAEHAAIRGGETGAEADRRFIALAREAQELTARWRHADEWLKEAAGRFGRRERLDARALAEALAVPDTVPDHLDALVADLDRAENRRADLAGRLQELAAERLPEPSNPAVVRLARADQDEVWEAANRAVATGVRLEQASLDLGGLPAEGTVSALAEQLEIAHADVEAAEHRLEQRRLPGFVVAAVSGIVSVVLIAFALWAAPLPLVIALAAAGWGIVEPNRRLARARGAEEDVLVKAGIGTYLGFHIRRIDATIDPAARERLNVCALQHRVALSAWHDVAGELDPAAALQLEDEVRQYARSLATLSGAADEIEAVRRELTTHAEPAARAALDALLAACAPYGVDDPTLAANMVRHQVEAGRTARLQKELEAAEQAERQVSADLRGLLTRLGFDEGETVRRVAALELALSAAVEREQARAVARSRDEVEAEMNELEARARREYQAEWGSSVVADDSAEPDTDALRRRRDELAAAYDRAIRVVPDTEHLADRRSAVERRVTVLEAALGDSPAAAALADTADIERYVQARLSTLRSTGREPLPLLLDEPFLRIRGERKWELLDLVERLSTKTQLVYLSDDPDVLLWARRRAAAGSLRLLEPVGEPGTPA